MARKLKAQSWIAFILLLCGLVASKNAHPASSSDLAGHYLIIVRTLPIGQTETSVLQPWSAHKAVLVRTDLFSGLRPGYEIVVTSAHKRKADALNASQELLRGGVRNYVRYAGEPVIGIPLSHEAATAWVRRRHQGNSNLHVLTVTARNQAFPLIISYRPLPNWNEADVEPDDVRGGARLFLFLSSTPVNIEGHGFHSPDDPDATRERPFLNCDPARVFHLSSQLRQPTVVAQECSESNRMIVRFLVFGETNLHDPTTGTTTWSVSLAAMGRRERFVPASAASRQGGRSPHRNDGKTVVDGEEIERMDGTKRIRSYRLEWDGQALRKKAGPWRLLQ